MERYGSSQLPKLLFFPSQKQGVSIDSSSKFRLTAFHAVPVSAAPPLLDPGCKSGMTGRREGGATRNEEAEGKGFQPSRQGRLSGMRPVAWSIGVNYASAGRSARHAWRYCTISSSGSTSAYFWFMSKRLMAWQASCRSKTHSSATTMRNR